MYQDVHVMVFIGFGYLLVFLKKHGFGSIGLYFLIAAFVIEWSLLLNGVFEHGWGGHHEVEHFGLFFVSLIFADFAAGAVLITFGAVLGKVSPLQLVVIAVFEIVFYNINGRIGVVQLVAIDMGGSMSYLWQLPINARGPSAPGNQELRVFQRSALL